MPRTQDSLLRSQRGTTPSQQFASLQTRHSVHGSSLQRPRIPRFTTDYRHSMGPGTAPSLQVVGVEGEDGQRLDGVAFDSHPSLVSDSSENGLDGHEDNGNESGFMTEEERAAQENSRTLRDVQEAINIKHPFGLRIWKPALYRKFRSIDTKTYKALHAVPGEKPARPLYLNPGNVLWCLLFGWWISLVYVLVALLVLAPVSLVGKVFATIWFCGRKREPMLFGIKTFLPWFFLELEHCWQYAKVLLNISGYMFWPFGKFIAKRRMYHMIFEQEDALDGSHADEQTSLLGDYDQETPGAHEDTYVVGISDESVPYDSQERAVNGSAPKFSPHHGDEDAGNLSDESEDSWREYQSSSRRYSITVSRAIHWQEWVPRWIRKLYSAGLSGCLFRLCVIVLIGPLHLVITCACTFFVFSLPMAKLNYVLLKHLLRHPLQISAHTPVNAPSPGDRPSRRAAIKSRASAAWRRTSQYIWRPASILSDTAQPIAIPTTLGTPTVMPTGAVAQGPQLAPEFQVILCTYNALGWEYYKYTIDGINIIFINLIAVVAFALLDFYFIGPTFGFHGIASMNVIFSASLISSIPLAYFIGMAVASITSETGSLAIGAVINATFGSIIEIILYMLALSEGKTRVVEGAVVGSLLAGLLALPGVSMFFGGIKRKEQRFNAKAAGVTATMLIMAVVGCFTPTLFQEIYGTQELTCLTCPKLGALETADAPTTLLHRCIGCRMRSTPPFRDSIYVGSTRYLVYFCSGLLILMYAVGLLFTLRTHSRVIYAKPKSSKRKNKYRKHRVSRFVKRSDTGGVAPSPALSAQGVPHEKDTSGAGTPLEGPSTHSRGSVHSTLRGRKTAFRTSQVPSENSGEPSLSEYPFPFVNGEHLNPESARSSSPSNRRSSEVPSTPMSPSLPPRRSVHTTGGVILVQDPDPVVAVQQGDDWDSASAHSSDEDDDSVADGGHDHPNWGLTKSAIVLLGCTVLYSLVAEVLISSVDSVVEKMGIGEKVLGVTLFSWVPLVTEFYNAIAFAMNNNIALSLEIGSAYVMQAAMLQIPVIIFFSNIYFPTTQKPITVPDPDPDHDHDMLATSANRLPSLPLRNLFNRVFGPGSPSSAEMQSASQQHDWTRAGPHHHAEGFTMIFPRWDLYAVIFGTFILTYIYIEGKANYFKGSMLLGAYAVLCAVYFFEPNWD